ncbi:MAG: protein phosphatase 2C domain-containing protein [Bacteroidales bacterium]|nr:protein phosphatase 2C domain-containing protein [Bacteroidales bacterium]
MEKILEIIKQLSGDVSQETINKFLGDTVTKIWKEYIMDIETVIKNKVDSLKITIPNASVNKEYKTEVPFQIDDISEYCVEGLEDTGLTIDKNENGFIISGTPTKSGTFPLVIKYRHEVSLLGKNLERKIDLIINPDPRSLWKDLPVAPDIEYPKENTQVQYIKVPSKDGTSRKDIAAASKRGRSHANEGKPRDDDFKLYHNDENDWYVIAVADGAGSAKYSREGSRIACEIAVNHCINELKNSENFEENIAQYNLFKDDSEAEARKYVGDDIYKIVGNAAFLAHKEIDKVADEKGVPSKLYATTLLLAIAKKFEFGWFVATFWVGDGAICLYSEDNNGEQPQSILMGVPDEGEFSGQTRFLTMPDIFKDSTSLYKRLRFKIVNDFTALFLMTDGVSDPWFETDSNLNNPEKWKAFYKEIQDNKEHPVLLEDDNEETAQQLLYWLDFWSPGNHDDRTIAILY